jgi:hypothetical protein
MACLEIPEDCRMAAGLTFGDDEVRFKLGDPFKEDLIIVFERLALERFVQLASDALAVKLPKDSKIDPTELVSVPFGSGRA